MLGVKYDPKEWRLFILHNGLHNGVILHSGNKLACIQVAHSVQLKEDYDTMEAFLHALNYTPHRGFICGDLKDISLLPGQQGGYSKYSCYPCLWDSRADARHYVQEIWSHREQLVPGSHNVIQEPLVDSKNVLSSLLHIKLGLMKKNAKALPKMMVDFYILTKNFPQFQMRRLKMAYLLDHKD